jgi:ABC-2 type transport system permease protein
MTADGAPRPATRRANWQGFRSLSRAMFFGFVRDRAPLFFTILFPVLFLLLFGSIYKSSSTPKVTVVEIGKVSVLDQARAASHGQLNKVLDVTRRASLATALNDVRQGNVDAAVQQQGGWAIASSGAFAAAITLVGWRKNKLLRRLRLAPVSTTSIVTARIAVSVAVAVVETFVFIAIATTPYFGLKLTAYWWMAIPVVICGTLAFLSIGLLVGALAKSQEAATALVNLIILPMAFLGGAFIPLAFAPQWIVNVSYVMPLRYLVIGMQNVMARGDGPASALPAMGLLLAFAAVLTLIAVRVFRWDEI